jgi:hypothetical protein
MKTSGVGEGQNFAVWLENMPQEANVLQPPIAFQSEKLILVFILSARMIAIPFQMARNTFIITT